MRTTIKKQTYKEMKFLADVRGQTMAELIDDVWVRFDKSLLVQAPPSSSRPASDHRHESRDASWKK